VRVLIKSLDISQVHDSHPEGKGRRTEEVESRGYGYGRNSFVMLIAVLLVGVGAGMALPEFYHTTEEVRGLIKELTEVDGPVHALLTDSVDAVDVYTEGSGKLQVTVICGEHPRELISVETCLAILRKVLASEEALALASLRIILNANPETRKQVEAGDYCLRTNPNGVDINRNWDLHWKTENCEAVSDECPGVTPMSEPEVLEIQQLLASAPPDVFITVHSGSYALLTPFAYDTEPATVDIAEMLTALTAASKDLLPHVEIGQTADILKYRCPGNLLDYVYSHTEARIVAVFEVYSQHSPFASFLSDHTSCFQTFNPHDPVLYAEVVDLWSEVFLRLLLQLDTNP